MKNTTEYVNTTAKNINQFISSVNQNKGYYIARFEASYGEDNKPNSKISTGTASTENEVAPTTEGVLWNNITQQNAASVCRNMYSEDYGIESDLMNSYAWDTALEFIQRYSGNPDYSIDRSGNNATRVPQNTGETGDVVCNIYDISGNYREWTTETSIGEGKPTVSRGGTFYVVDAGTIRYASSIYKDSRDSMFYILSFRPILYIK